MLIYTLDKININDSWYIKEGDIYHTFFLESGCDEPFASNRHRVGHMTSKNLVDWTYHGVVLKAEDGIWNDRGVATGSIVKHGDLYYMLYTGHSSDAELDGIGLAVSSDLFEWTRVGESSVISAHQLYPFKHEGEQVMVCPLADPYIYPEPIDGYYYIFVNSWVAGRDMNKRGGQAVFITKDFKEFLPHKIAVISDCDRMETPQVWKHGEKYYMYVGQATVEAPPEANILTREHFSMITKNTSFNSIMISDAIDGPYTFVGELKFPEPPKSGVLYIAKVFPDPKGREICLVNNVPNGVMGPYPVIYEESGMIRLIEE